MKIYGKIYLVSRDYIPNFDQSWICNTEEKSLPFEWGTFFLKHILIRFFSYSFCRSLTIELWWEHNVSLYRIFLLSPIRINDSLMKLILCAKENYMINKYLVENNSILQQNKKWFFLDSKNIITIYYHW